MYPQSNYEKERKRKLQDYAEYKREIKRGRKFILSKSNYSTKQKIQHLSPEILEDLGSYSTYSNYTKTAIESLCTPGSQVISIAGKALGPFASVACCVADVANHIKYDQLEGDLEKIQTSEGTEDIVSTVIEATKYQKKNRKVSAGSNAVGALTGVLTVAGVATGPIGLGIVIGLAAVGGAASVGRQLFRSRSHNSEKQSLLKALESPEEYLNKYRRKINNLENMSYGANLRGRGDLARKYAKEICEINNILTDNGRLASSVRELEPRDFYKFTEKSIVSMSAKFSLDSLVYMFESDDLQKRIQAQRVLIGIFSHYDRDLSNYVKFIEIEENASSSVQVISKRKEIIHRARYQSLKECLKVKDDLFGTESNMKRFRKAIYQHSKWSDIL